MLMTELEDFIVHDPYPPTDKEKTAISELEQKGLVSDDWNSQKKGIKSFKANILDYMYYEQNCRCAYCRIEIPIACCFLQREHIVPKKLHPQWTFNVRNLCFTCDRCNNYKKDEEVLAHPEVKDYPFDSREFLIINPFLDKYSDHIKLENDIVYVGKTDKGRFTIQTCHLYNLDLVLERAKTKMKNENPDSVKSQVLSLLSELPVPMEEENKILTNLEKVVKMYKRSR